MTTKSPEVGDIVTLKSVTKKRPEITVEVTKLYPNEVGYMDLMSLKMSEIETVMFVQYRRVDTGKVGDMALTNFMSRVIG